MKIIRFVGLFLVLNLMAVSGPGMTETDAGPVAGAALAEFEVRFRAKVVWCGGFWIAEPGYGAGCVVEDVMMMSGPVLPFGVEIEVITYSSADYSEDPCDAGYVDPTIMPGTEVEVYGRVPFYDLGLRNVGICEQSKYYIRRAVPVFTAEVAFRGRYVGEAELRTASPQSQSASFPPSCRLHEIDVSEHVAGPQVMGSVLVGWPEGADVGRCERGSMEMRDSVAGDLVEARGQFFLDPGHGQVVSLCGNQGYYLTRVGPGPSPTATSTPTRTAMLTSTPPLTATPTATSTPEGSYQEVAFTGITTECLLPWWPDSRDLCWVRVTRQLWYPPFLPLYVKVELSTGFGGCSGYVDGTIRAPDAVDVYGAWVPGLSYVTVCRDPGHFFRRLHLPHKGYLPVALK